MKARDIPNLISILRILLVAPTVYYLLNEEYILALVLFIIAGASDGVDGFLARYFRWQSRLGAILDPIGDKLLLISCYLAMGWLGHIPVSLIVLVLLRDIIIVAGAVAYHIYIEEVLIEPVLISKFNTLSQILLIVILLFDLSGVFHSDFITDSLMSNFIWLVYITTAISGVVYMWLWGKRALQKIHNGAAS